MGAALHYEEATMCPPIMLAWLPQRIGFAEGVFEKSSEHVRTHNFFVLIHGNLFRDWIYGRCSLKRVLNMLGPILFFVVITEISCSWGSII